MSAYVGAVLAAGRGRRMGSLSDYYPKPLLPVANRELIVHQLLMMHDLGIRQVYIVVGHNASAIVQALGNGDKFGLQLTYVEQEETLGSAHALGQLAPYIKNPLVLFLGDYFIYAPQIRGMLDRSQEHSASVMAAKPELDPKNLHEACMLNVDDNGRILQIIEKPVILNSNLKGCGVYVLQPDFFDAVRRTPRTALRNEYELSVTIDLYIQSGQPMFAEQIVEWDRNFTRPEDVLFCNLEWLSRNSQNKLIGRNVSLAPGTRVTQTIVGNNTSISKPAVFKDCVVFADTRFESSQSVNHSLVTPHLVIPCLRGQ